MRPALPVLARLLHGGDDEVQTDASWALSYVSDGEDERVQAVVEAGVAPRLVELLSSLNPAMITPVLRTLGNFVSGDERHTQAVLDCGFLARCPALLAHPKRSVRKEASWAISNVTAGTQAQIQAVLDAGLLPRLVELLGGDDEPDVQKEACWAVSNATSGGSPAQLRAVAAAGCVPALCARLPSADARVVAVSLEALENLLRLGAREADAAGQGAPNTRAQEVARAGGGAALRELGGHGDDDVARRAAAVLAEHPMLAWRGAFDDDSEDEDL